MRSSRALLALALSTAFAMAIVPASADPEDPAFCNTLDGGSSTMHLVDPANDYQGTVGGNGSALIPYGDVNGPGTDIIGSWVSLNAENKYEAVIAVAGISGLETNANWYLQWRYAATPGDPKTSRFVSASVVRPIGSVTNPTQPIYAFEYGYIDTASTPNLIEDEGNTTGQIVPGTPGLIKIVIPFNKLGNPPVGATLGTLSATTRVLLGAAGTGLLGVADQALGFPCIDLVRA